MAVVVLLLGSLAGSAAAQDQGAAPAGAAVPAAPGASAPLATGADDLPSAASRLDAAKAAIDGVTLALRRSDMSDPQLTELRNEADLVASQMSALAAELAPRVEAAKARIAELGPKPAPGAAPEAAEISAERATQEKLFDALDSTGKRARVLAILADQTSDAIVARRRALFANALFARSTSLLSPGLWLSVARALPADARALAMLAEDWAAATSRRLSAVERLALLGALVLICALSGLAWRVARRFRERPAEATPTRLRMALAAVRVAVATAAVPIAAVLASGGLATGLGVPSQFEPVGRSLALGVAAVACLTGLARGLLAPKSPNWRLPPIADDAAKILYHLLIQVTAPVAAARVAAATESFISAAPATIMVTTSVGTVAVVLAILHAFRRVRDVRRRSAGLVRTARFEHWSAVSRTVSWAIVVILLGALAAGYVPFATFLTEQLIALAGTMGLLYLALVFADEGIAAALNEGTPLGRWLIVVGSLRPGTIDQVAVVLTGTARVALYGAAVLLILAPWQVESGDMTATLEAAFFGFTVGDVTISLSSTLVAVLLFALVFGATRAVQGWLEAKFLPRTTLDTGLRNALRTSLGYLGLTIAVAIALAHLGLSFERLAFVAGALSVGIGFGLQSVVNNFVSGLILLWERAIRVGDWISVGDEQGYVRRINVRSTEIETFDRALVIMPNSSLIAGVVKNWVRNDRVGRIKLPFTLPLSADPEDIRSDLIAAAKAHDLVLAVPAPQVFFIGIADTALRFELMCFIEDVESASRITSDLLFDIHARFKARGLVQPAAPALVTSPALERIDAWLSGKSTVPSPVGAP